MGNTEASASVLPHATHNELCGVMGRPLESPESQPSPNFAVKCGCERGLAGQYLTLQKMASQAGISVTEIYVQQEQPVPRHAEMEGGICNLINLRVGVLICVFPSTAFICFEYLTNYQTQIGGVINTITEAADAFDCQRLCGENIDCDGFTYQTVTKDCQLKTGDLSNKIYEENVISGPRECNKL